MITNRNARQEMSVLRIDRGISGALPSGCARNPSKPCCAAISDTPRPLGGPGVSQDTPALGNGWDPMGELHPLQILPITWSWVPHPSSVCHGCHAHHLGHAHQLGHAHHLGHGHQRSSLLDVFCVSCGIALRLLQFLSQPSDAV